MSLALPQPKLPLSYRLNPASPFKGKRVLFVELLFNKGLLYELSV